MNEILEIYKNNFSERDKIFFKEFLDDIFKNIFESNNNSESYFFKKEKEKLKTLSCEKFEKIIEKDFSKIKSEKQIFLKNLILEEKENIIKDIFGKNFDLKTHKIIFFEIYKGNDEKFIFRRNLTNLLAEKNLIYISKFNFSKEFKNFLNGDFEPELEEIIKIGKDYIKNLKEIFGEYFIKQEEEKILNSEKRIEFLTFKLETLEELYKNIEKIEKGKIIFKNGALEFNGKYYFPKKYSDRYLFLELFFNENGKKYFSKKEILDYLENGIGDIYDEKQRKRILTLYKKLNSTIEKKLGIKNLFSLGKGEYEGYILLNF